MSKYWDEFGAANFDKDLPDLTDTESSNSDDESGDTDEESVTDDDASDTNSNIKQSDSNESYLFYLETDKEVASAEDSIFSGLDFNLGVGVEFIPDEDSDAYNDDKFRDGRGYDDDPLNQGICDSPRRLDSPSDAEGFL